MFTRVFSIVLNPLMHHLSPLELALELHFISLEAHIQVN